MKGLMSVMKHCNKCNKTKKLDLFYKHAGSKDGHQAFCKECHSSHISRYAKSNREHVKDTKRKSSMRTGHVAKTKWIERNVLKRKAHHAVSNAIRDGRMKRKPCRICGEKAHAHHDDYTKPLKVLWFCPQHHKDHHAKISF